MSESLTTPMEVSEPIQTPITVNQGNNTNEILGPDSTVIFTTPFNKETYYTFLCFLTMFSLVIIFLIIMAIIQSEIRLLLGSLGVLVFAIIFLMGTEGCEPLTISIIVDRRQGIVLIKKKKMFPLFTTKSIHISEIQEVIIQRDYGLSRMDDSPVGAFELIFKLIDKREIKAINGLSGTYDNSENSEVDKVYYTLRNSLPQNIPISGNLVNH